MELVRKQSKVNDAIESVSAHSRTRLSAIGFKPKALLLDFDGVFTENKVCVDQNGVESVFCDRSDGWGIEQLKKTDIKIAVLSTEINPVVLARCTKLNIECQQGLGEKKIESFHYWCAKNGVAPQDTVFIGNDENDIECLKVAGCGVVPAEAHPKAKEIGDVVLEKNGGNGAIRKLCNMIINQRHEKLSGVSYRHR